MATKSKTKNKQYERRRARVRAKIFGTPARPRLCASRSLKHIRVSLIDDSKGHTLASISDIGKKPAEGKAQSEKKIKSIKAREAGLGIAKKAKELGIESVVFDRTGRKYHGRIKEVAEGAREGGLKF